jgi:hypothetical protein
MNIIEQFLQELNYISSGDTKVIDWDKWGNEQSCLLVIGWFGSGKTTMGKKLRDKYNVEWQDTDYILYPNLPDLSVKREKSAVHKMMLDYLTKKGPKRILSGSSIFILTRRDPSKIPLLLKSPVIILGTSYLKSISRVASREKERSGKVLDIVGGVVDLGVLNLKRSKEWNRFEKLRESQPGAKVEKFNTETLKPYR